MQSQWGPVHLFDLCLRCDHLGMALALADRCVPGCVFEDHHLGPIGRGSSLRYTLDVLGCNCQGWGTCEYCCWAFPVEQGIWMQDSDVDFFAIDWEGPVGAIPAAQKAAAMPLTRAMLDICSRDFSGSPKAMARLLDIAILTGNRKAAVNLSKKCQLRPLRRWVMGWKSEGWKAGRTALWAGADFQDLMVKEFVEDVPFPQALFLESKLEDWQEIRHLLPRCQDLWRPRNLDNGLGHFFYQPGVGQKLFVGKIPAAEDAGLDLRCLFVKARCEGDATYARGVTLLDIAILCSQPDCAEACVDGGIELKGDRRTLAWHRRALRGESLRLHAISFSGSIVEAPDVVPSEAQTAAAAAGCAWLKRLWKRESSQKGIVLYQMMVKMFKGRSFPMALVQEILTFSMPVPKIIDQLDLWEHVGDWMTTICGRPAFVHPATNCNTADVGEPEGMQDNEEAGRLRFIGVLVFVLFPLVAAKHQNSKWEPFPVTIIYYILAVKIDKGNDPFKISLKHPNLCINQHFLIAACTCSGKQDMEKYNGARAIINDLDFTKKFTKSPLQPQISSKNSYISLYYIIGAAQWPWC